MNTFSCSLSCTRVTLIDYLFHASDSLFSEISLEYIAKLVVAWL